MEKKIVNGTVHSHKTIATKPVKMPASVVRHLHKNKAVMYVSAQSKRIAGATTRTKMHDESSTSIMMGIDD